MSWRPTTGRDWRAGDVAALRSGRLEISAELAADLVEELLATRRRLEDVTSRYASVAAELVVARRCEAG